MKKFIIAVAVICFFCSSAFAADYCDTKYMEIINKLKKTEKILSLIYEKKSHQKERKDLPIVIIESPFAGDVDKNIEYARKCVRDSLNRGEAPSASHLLYTQPGILDDDEYIILTGYDENEDDPTDPDRTRVMIYNSKGDVLSSFANDFFLQLWEMIEIKPSIFSPSEEARAARLWHGGGIPRQRKDAGEPRAGRPWNAGWR